MSKRKIFYYFPYKRFPALLYAHSSIFTSALFKVFYFKLLPNNIWIRLRKNNLFLGKCCELVSRQVMEIPHEDINLIYKGYGHTLHFEFDSPEHIRQVWRGEGKLIKPEPFLGYPIYYDFESKYLNDAECLQSFLSEHWQRVKEGQPLHGDLTHYNILIDNAKNINLIDAKKKLANSVISDHFYFYAYLLTVLKKHSLSDDNTSFEIKNQLNRIYKKIFQHEKKEDLLKWVDEIDFSQFVLPEAKDYIPIFIQKIIN